MQGTWQRSRWGEDGLVDAPEADAVDGGCDPSKLGVADSGGFQSQFVIVKRPCSVQSIDVVVSPSGESHIISKNEGTNMLS